MTNLKQKQIVGAFKDNKQILNALMDLRHKFPRRCMSISDVKLPKTNKTLAKSDLIKGFYNKKEVPIWPEDQTILISLSAAILSYLALAISAMFADTALDMTSFLWSLGLAATVGVSTFFIGQWLLERNKNKLTHFLNNDGSAIWIKTENERQEQVAFNLLKKHGALFVEHHQIA